MKWFGMFLLMLLSLPVLARSDIYEFTDPQKEERFNTLSSELRCLVCQNQTIADSNADLAKDLRQQIYEMLKKDQSDAEILDFMVARYGDFVLYHPPFKKATLALWVGPFILLGIGLFFLRQLSLKRTQKFELNDEQRQQMRTLLDGGGKDS